MISLLLLFFTTQCLGYEYGMINVYERADGYIPFNEFRYMPSLFGSNFNGLSGLLVNGEPADGCTALKEPPIDTNPWKTWIVVVQRYNCSFEQKVRMAQAASYDAVIVYNVNSNQLEPMSANNRTAIYIPSAFVGSDAGGLLKTYDYHGYYIVIQDSDPHIINEKLLLPFAVIVGVCFIIMIGMMIVKCVKDRVRQRRHRLPSSTLDKIPTLKFTKGDPYETCAICLDDYIEGEKLRVLPCAHAYHYKCIDPWLTKSRRVCPVCKRKVFAHNETPIPDTDSDSDTDDRSPLITPFSRYSHGTFSRPRENPFQRAVRSVSQLGVGEQGYPNEGLFVTASGEHSINNEGINVVINASVTDTQTDADGTETVPSVNDMPSTSVDRLEII